MKIQVKLIDNIMDKATVLSIRRKVFIVEQNIPEAIEIDEHEEDSTYILAYVDGTPVGTARWRHTDAGEKLERFAVLPDFRSYGVGRKLVEFIQHHLVDSKKMFLNSQYSTIGFYEKLGFVAQGPTFIEADIIHQKMEYQNKQS